MGFTLSEELLSSRIESKVGSIARWQSIFKCNEEKDDITMKNAVILHCACVALTTHPTLQMAICLDSIANVLLMGGWRWEAGFICFTIRAPLGGLG